MGKKHAGGRVRDARIEGIHRSPCKKAKVFTKEEIAKFMADNPEYKAPTPDVSLPNLRKAREEQA